MANIPVLNNFGSASAMSTRLFSGDIMIDIFFQMTITKKHRIVRCSAIKLLDNNQLLLQGTVQKGSMFLSPLPWYPFLLPTRSDISGRDSSLHTLL